MGETHRLSSAAEDFAEAVDLMCAAWAARGWLWADMAAGLEDRAQAARQRAEDAEGPDG